MVDGDTFFLFLSFSMTTYCVARNLDPICNIWNGEVQDSLEKRLKSSLILAPNLQMFTSRILSFFSINCSWGQYIWWPARADPKDILWLCGSIQASSILLLQPPAVSPLPLWHLRGIYTLFGPYSNTDAPTPSNDWCAAGLGCCLSTQIRQQVSLSLPLNQPGAAIMGQALNLPGLWRDWTTGQYALIMCTVWASKAIHIW